VKAVQERGKEALTRLGISWGYHFVFVRKFLTVRATGRVVDHHPIIFEIRESAVDGEGRWERPGEQGRVFGTVTVDLAEHVKMINPWEKMKTQPYEVELTRHEPGTDLAAPKLDVEIKVVTPTILQRVIFKGHDVAEELGLVKNEDLIEKKRFQDIVEHEAAGCQIPSVDAMIMGLRKERNISYHEFENQLTKAVTQDVRNPQASVLITARLVHADQIKMEAVIPLFEAKLGYAILNTDKCRFEMGCRGETIMVFLTLENTFDATIVKNMCEEFSVSVDMFPMSVHFSSQAEDKFLIDFSNAEGITADKLDAELEQEQDAGS